ncbi:MAG: carbohydrate-binding protein [Candidatus Acidiferrales bacterium]
MAQLAIIAAIEVAEIVISRLLQPEPGRPALENMQFSTATNGAPIPFGYGQVRLGGNCIWTPGITYVTQTQSSGSGSSGVVGYLYYASFAFAFGEGPAFINRIWGDSKLIYDANPADLSDLPPADFPPWNAMTEYNTGNEVAYEGQVYQCILTNTGELPTDVTYWTPLGSFPPWSDLDDYAPGDVVTYAGQVWVCGAPNGISSSNVQVPGSGATTTYNNTSDVPYWTLLTAYYPQPTIYPGDQFQLQDPLISGAEGLDLTPAHRGICYAVWETFPLANFGNRIPNIRAEITFQKALAIV